MRNGLRTKHTHSYEYDRVFGPDATQSQIFTEVKPLMVSGKLGLVLMFILSSFTEESNRTSRV